MHHQSQVGIALGSILVSVAGLAATLYIAYRQYRTTRDEQKLKLYDRRLQIYQHSCDYVAEIIQNGDVEYPRSIEFLRATRESTFLFNEDIPTYLRELYKAGIDLQLVASRLNPQLPAGEERYKLAEQQGQLRKYFGEQAVALPERFKKYLNLGSIS
jgi:hypothetical protein